MNENSPQISITPHNVKVETSTPVYPACVEYGLNVAKERKLSASITEGNLEWTQLETLKTVYNKEENQSLSVVMNVCARELESIKIVGNCSIPFSKYGICPQPGSTVSIAFKEELSNGSGSVSGELHICYTTDGTCTTSAVSSSTQNKKVAIIGLGIFFPAGCEDLDTYWDFLVKGKCAIREPTPDRCILRRDLKVKAGFTNDVGGFDAQFFKMSPLEASQLDPQQFHLLECTWEALEDAGYKPGDLVNSPTAVMIGCGFGEHLSQAVSDPTTCHASPRRPSSRA